MPFYRRNRVPGGTYFFTLVTRDRRPWLCERRARAALRGAIEQVRRDWPFRVDAWVLLPDHLHCLWTLPPGDADYSTRWRLVKSKHGLCARPADWPYSTFGRFVRTGVYPSDWAAEPEASAGRE